MTTVNIQSFAESIAEKLMSNALSDVAKLNNEGTSSSATKTVEEVNETTSSTSKPLPSKSGTSEGAPQKSKCCVML